MTTYADRSRCPDCGALLPRDPGVCPVCSLPLTGQTAVSLFTTLQEADRLLGILRARRAPAPAVAASSAFAATASAAAAPASGPGGLLRDAEPYPLPSLRGPQAPGEREPRVRLSGASVPRILLSLGALCLLVAAVVFLAVAWSWLGVGGRTAVLLTLTTTALALTVVLHRRGLRTAAEALSVVGLGLLALDVVGMRHAGWFGPVSDAHTILLAGAVMATASVGLLVLMSGRPLVTPAVVAPCAVLVAGFAGQWRVGAPLPVLGALVAILALGRLGTFPPSLALRVTSPVAGAPAWLFLVADGLDRAGHPVTLHRYAGHVACWPLVAATALVAVAAPVVGVRRALVPGYAVAALLGTYAALLPVLDNGRTPMTLSLLTAGLAWLVLLTVGSRRARLVAALPTAGTVAVPVALAAGLLAEALRTVLDVGMPFSRPFGVHLVASTTEVSPLVLLPTLLVAAAAACALAALVRPVSFEVRVLALGAAALVGVLGTVALYAVPLALVVGLLLLTAVAAVAAGTALPTAAADGTWVAAPAVALAASWIAVPSDRMATGALLVACALAAGALRRGDAPSAIGSVLLPVSAAGLLWTAGNVLGVDEQLRAVPVLIALGALAVRRPRAELEISAAACAVVASIAAIGAAGDAQVSLAVHLTVAGVLVVASSLVNPDRRWLAWPGGLLLAAATWVRLLDLGVHVPEAYTLPSALVLVAVGAWRLRADDSSTTLTALAPGLTLATLPSLIATWDAPYSWRALLLGCACLGLVVLGSVRRWSAPVFVGAAVGAGLVLRELAPYAAQVPTWVGIGAAGTILLVVGVTWEARMGDVRRAAHYLAALR